MQNIEIEKLKNHPKNKEFFDDIHGEQWEDFKKSIVRRGVVEGIVVTQDLMIVSGHQRVRACKELGVLEVPCRITHYPDVDKKTGNSKEDMILEDLICTNIMQRGVGNVNPMKMAKCIMELERIYGIKNGNNQWVGNNFVAISKTQDDLAKQVGIDQRQLQNYKKLNNLIPELQSLIENGSMKATVGYKIWAKMPYEEQEKFFNEIGRDKIKKLTQKATQELINEKNQTIKEKETLEKAFNDLSKKYNAEKNKEPKIVERVINNTDDEKLNRLQRELDYKEKQYQNLLEREDIYKEKIKLYEKDSDDYKQLKNQIELLTKEKDDIGRAVKSATELSGYIYEVENFLKTKLAPVTYSRALLDCKGNPTVIKNVTEIIECVEKWCRDTRKILPSGNQKNIINVDIMEEC